MVRIRPSLAQLQDQVEIWLRSQWILRWGLCLGLGLLLAWSLSPRALSQDAPLPAPPSAAPSLDTQELLQPPSTPLQPLVPGAPLPNSAPPGEFPATNIPPLRDDQVQADPTPSDAPLQLDTGVGREIVIEKQSPDQNHPFREGEVPIVLMERFFRQHCAHHSQPRDRGDQSHPPSHSPASGAFHSWP
ncbi:MAG: hypothetical protein HC921_19500 [Synechococcaceae cyanobacterium SM2_3_1]|nr:hypothetical protein [Synechococcaceae cyanobacterium SM2_3_1]